ncbi:MAG: hypothetical protein HC836_40705 [Richelia sp. RM2_1_2]|nr:hypothetical protein [Richelia sp. RM2_1_2]
MNLKCQIRYKILESNLIFNYIGPAMGYHRNPRRESLINKRIEEQNARDNFYNKLEASILCEGIRNPIIVNAGWISSDVFNELPDEVQVKGLHNLIICFQIGGSRLHIAQKHNIPMPCIIRDFVHRFDDCPLIDSEDKVRKLYTDQPNKVLCDGKQVNIAWSGANF